MTYIKNMAKHYRVVKDTFLWEEGAILESTGSGYRPLHDVWNKTKFNGDEYISDAIIENNPDYFERVYSNSVEKMIFKTAAQLKDSYNKLVS